MGILELVIALPRPWRLAYTIDVSCEDYLHGSHYKCKPRCSTQEPDLLRRYTAVGKLSSELYWIKILVA